MRHGRSAVAFAAAFLACAAAHAQVSLLRVTCEGDDVGAEVTLNGKFRGECPVDIQAGTGTVKLRVVKKVDATHERVFEREYRMGDGGMQRAEALLGPAQPSAEGLRIEAGRLAAERLQAASRKQVREAALAAGLIPPRPQIPLEVSEDIWQIIEASEAYQKLPRSRSVTVSSQATKHVEFTGSKGASLPKPAASKVEIIMEKIPLGEKCTATRGRYTEGEFSSDQTEYWCGILLGNTYTVSGNPGDFIGSIDELKGSLFPMRIGNRISIRDQMADTPQRRTTYQRSESCEVMSRGIAGDVDPRLTGAAWKVHCQRNIAWHKYDDKIIASEYDDYFLEDLGVMLSAIGAFDSLKNAIVLPSPGSKIVFVVEGENGSRTTTTYTRYDWSVGK